MPRCGACGDEHLSESGAALPRFCPRTGDPCGLGPCGTQIDRYRVERWIGGGGLGAVYRARHAILGHEVALKLLLPKVSHDAEVVGRFVREARSAASIGSPHIVRVLDIGTSAEGRPFLAMELLQGQDLAWLLSEEAPLAVPRAVALARQLLDGLGAAHAAGIVHRDVKPANVFLVHPVGWAAAAGDSEPEFLKILDFGISKIVGAEPDALRTRTGMVLGTPHYMSPEQARGDREVDARTDLYSTGVILYQMLSGVLPRLGASGQEVLAKLASDASAATHTAGPIPLSRAAPTLPPALIAVVDRALQVDPRDRWPSAAEMSDALARAVDEKRPVGPGAAPPRAALPATRDLPVVTAAAAAPSVAPDRRGHRKIAAAIAGAVLLLAGGLTAALWARGAPAPPALVVAPALPPAALPAPVTVPDPENPPDVVAATMRSSALVAAPPFTPQKPVTMGPPLIRGGLATSAVREALDRALPALDSCRVAGRQQRVRLQIALTPSGQVVREAFGGNEADRASSACAFAQIAATAQLPLFPKGATFLVEVLLAGR